MSRPSKPARLWLRPAKYDAAGKIRVHAVWCIVDGGSERSTGCGADDRQGAEQALSAYIGDKHDPSRARDQAAVDVAIADVVTIYLRDKIADQVRPEKAAQRFVQLLEWWGDKRLSDVNGRACRDYVAWRCSQPWKSAKPDKTGNAPRMVTPAGARRELEDLRSAINYHQAEGYHREVVKVTLPKKGQSRTRYLRRSELALMVLTAWRAREQMKVVRGPRKGEPVLSKKRPSRHIARFLLVGAYTGSRAAAICGAAFEPTPGRGWIDLESGLFYRQGVGIAESNKRQPTVLLPRRLLTHIRRWKRLNPSQKFVVEYRGKPVAEVNKGFATLVDKCGLGADVTPHVLRHTCATWLAQRGAGIYEASSFLGMSQAIYEKTYMHHHPGQRSAGFINPPIWVIFDPKYHPSDIEVSPYVEAGIDAVA